jgi:hypothetical protein
VVTILCIAWSHFCHCAVTLLCCAPPGSSSGLHHDFHDNLYVLLRGCKRFRLYPPDAAPGMYVRGKLQRIYPNGRIVYEGQGDVLPDGSGEPAQLLMGNNCVAVRCCN